MKKTVISFGLSEREIGKAIKELEQYKKELVLKTALLRKKVADRIAELAQSGFNGAVVDDLLKGGVKTAHVDVQVTDSGEVSLVIANGEDAVWVEFGAGVYHNGSIGSSPHPRGSELGFTIGGYGHGRGKQQMWKFKNDDGELVWTHGTPASMPMYNAVKTVCNEIATIAREVWK